MNNKAEQMKRKVEMLIDIAKSNYNGEWTTAHQLRLARIDGFLDALSILTDKEYYYDTDGLHER